MLASDIDLIKVEQAENMSMSIRPTSSGLTFIIYEGQNFDGAKHEGFLPIEASPKAWSERISELFFSHNVLALPFHRVKLCYEPQQGLIIPRELYKDDFDDLWQSYLNSDEELLCLKEGVENEAKKLLFYYPKDFLNFLKRTHLRLLEECYLIPLMKQDKQQSRQRGRRRLSLSLRYGALDCWLIAQGELQFYNSYKIIESQNAQAIEGELMYYLFMLVGELGLNLEEDEVQLYPNTSEHPSIQTLLNEALGLLDNNLSERILNYNKAEDKECVS